MTAPLAAPAAPAVADVLGADLHPCPHLPPCPAADAPNHDAARVVAEHHDQGWELLCNGVIVFDDTGELLPDDGPTGCHAEPPHRPEPRHCTNPDHETFHVQQGQKETM